MIRHRQPPILAATGPCHQTEPSPEQLFARRINTKARISLLPEIVNQLPDSRAHAIAPSVDAHTKQMRQTQPPILRGILEFHHPIDMHEVCPRHQVTRITDLAEPLLIPAIMLHHVGAGEQHAERILPAAIHAGVGQNSTESPKCLVEARPLLDHAAQNAAPDHRHHVRRQRRQRLACRQPRQTQQRHAREVLRLEWRRVDRRKHKAGSRAELHRIMPVASAQHQPSGCRDARELQHSFGLADVRLALDLVDSDGEAVQPDVLIDTSACRIDGLDQIIAEQILDDPLQCRFACRLIARDVGHRAPRQRATDKRGADPSEKQRRIDFRPRPLPTGKQRQQQPRRIGSIIGNTRPRPADLHPRRIHVAIEFAWRLRAAAHQNCRATMQHDVAIAPGPGATPADAIDGLPRPLGRAGRDQRSSGFLSRKPIDTRAVFAFFTEARPCP